MMISPESYYEMNLKGKSEKEIRSAIRGLKKQIGHLKNVMEHPEYGSAPIIHPSEAVQLHWTRKYLRRAIQALEDAGGTYISSQADVRAAIFDSNIPNISKIIFSIGGYFSGNSEYTICIGEKLTATLKEMWTDAIPHFLLNEDGEPYSVQEFLEGIACLHLGEWRSKYTPARFGYEILDGTQWELKVQYKNGQKPFRVYGDNIYPHNFSGFLSLLGINEQEGDENEND